MATIFLWCCRRVRRANSPDPPTPGHSGEQEGKGRFARSRSLAAQIERKLQPKKKKKKSKARGEGETKQEEDELGDLSAVKRETEVLKSYQKPPPPKNRARASRALRTQKSQNPGTSHDLFQVLDETPNDLHTEDGPEQEAGPSQQDQQDSQELDDNNSSAAVHSTDDGAQTVQPPPSENLNLSKQTSVEIENHSHADDDDDTQKDSSVSKESTPEPSDQEELKEPPVAEPADSGGQEDVCKTSSPKTSQSEDETPESTNEDASLNPEGEDSVTVQTKNDVSSVSSADGGGDDVGGEGADASHEEGEEEVREDLEEPGKTCALAELNTTSINSDAAAEDHIKKVSLRPVSSFKEPSSLVKHTSGKGKHCPIPSVHGEEMDELMKCLQDHLKEDGTSLYPADKTVDQKTEGSEQEPEERVDSHSDPTPHLDGTEDTEHQTADSQE